jgi:hypothetical protein
VAWWVALVVALHFLPLGLLLQDLSIFAVGMVLAVALLVFLARLRGSRVPTSAVVGVLMGSVLLVFGLTTGGIALTRLATGTG